MVWAAGTGAEHTAWATQVGSAPAVPLLGSNPGPFTEHQQTLELSSVKKVSDRTF